MNKLKKNKKQIAILLVIAMILSFFAGISIKVRAASSNSDVYLWFSNSGNGGMYPYANPNQTVYVNYYYYGEFENYDVTILVTDSSGNTIFHDLLTNSASASESLTLGKEGTYTAVITIKEGEITITRKSQIEVVNSLPVIIKQPTNKSTALLTDTEFSVEAEEDTEYQWYKASYLWDEGVEMSGSSSPTLTITSQNVVSEINGSYYYCKMTKGEKTITSNYARLYIRGQSLPTLPPKATKASSSDSTSTVDSPDDSSESEKTDSAESGSSSAGTSSDASQTTAKPASETETPTSPAPTQNTDSGASREVLSPKTQYKVDLIDIKYNAKANKVTVYYNTTGDVAYLALYRSEGDKNNFKKVAVTKKSSSCISDTSPKVGKKYYYKIQYIKVDGNTYINYDSNTRQIKTSRTPKIKSFKAKKISSSKLKLQWSTAGAKNILIYVKSGKKYSYIGGVAAKRKKCVLTLAPNYGTIKVKILAKTVYGKKKYYSKYSAAKKIKF